MSSSGNSIMMELIVYGYMRIMFVVYTPHVIIRQIKAFYDETFRIFDHKYIVISKNIPNIKQLYINRLSKLFVTTDNNIYGLVDNELSQFKVENIKNSNVALIGNGNSSRTIYLYTNDHKFYWGDFSYDYKLLGPPILFKNIPFKSPLISIKCGGYHALFLSLKGVMYCFGDDFSGRTSILDINVDPYEISAIPYFKNIKITQIGCCFGSSHCIDNNSQLYTFGNNKFGEMGIGPGFSSKINLLGWNNVISIDSGCHHIGFTTKNSNGYMFGKNKNGQCDPESNKLIEYTPTQIRLDTKIDKIMCGGYHSIIKTRNNEYYSFGKNNNGQCLHNSKEKKMNKISLNDIKHKIGVGNIIEIIPGYNETFIFQRNYIH